MAAAAAPTAAQPVGEGNDVSIIDISLFPTQPPPFLENNNNLPNPTATTSTVIPVDGLQQQWSMMYPVMPVGRDPTMMGIMPMGFNQFGFMPGPSDPAITPLPPMIPMIPGGTVKEIIHCKSCTLFPPNPSCPPPTTRERPPGCRTIFIGGLPENITEDIVREVFARFGEITTIRMSKKNFCHTRYDLESYADAAIFLSGYRIRIGSNNDAANTGRLHVDYAQARDDLYEWECRQRQIQREHRHRERIEQERQRSPSPPPVVHYSDHEASVLAEMIKAAAASHPGGGSTGGADAVSSPIEDNFTKAVQILIIWLDRGDCNKKNCGQFYSMIQSTNSHVRRLMSEKAQYEDEVLKVKERLKQHMHGILVQFNHIEKVFVAASHQKVWDHFTKAQRKNIDMWRKQAQEIKNAQLEDALNERVEDEMDLSDEDMDGASCSKRPKMDDEQVLALTSQVNGLKEENDNLRCQLEAYKNEVDLVKSDNKQELENKDKQLKALQQALQGLQQQLIQVNQQRQKDEETMENLRRNQRLEKDKSDGKQNEQFPSSSVNILDIIPASGITITEKEAKLIGLLSTFLHVHPFGASVDYICSYLQRLDSSLRTSDVEALLRKFPNIFKQELTGVGASLERKWIFTGFLTK